MLQPLRSNPQRQRVAKVATLPVAIRGWNTRDKLTETRDAPYYAPVLTNFVPNNSRLELRSGYTDHATGLTDDVESLMAFTTGSAEKMFAASGTAIYDVTAAGPASSSVTGLTNARFQHTMFATTSGQYLVAVNGADGVRTYDGSAWASQAITGVDENTFIGVTSHKGKLWFIEDGTLSLWYLATFAIAGAATEFDIGALCQHGGELMALATWTRDGGSGPDDLLVMVTSEGEVVVYAGTDPSSADTWALAGIFKIDKPLGRRCVIKLGGDLAILTESGVIQLSAVMAAVDQKDAISDPIRDQFVAAAADTRATYGWELAYYSARSWLIVNVPQLSTGTYDQFVFNTLNRAWTRFTGINAICWHPTAGTIYFGGPDGLMAQADNGTSDDGTNITGDYQPSWSRFGTSFRKRFTMCRPNFFADGTPTPLIAIKTDYDDTTPTAPISTIMASSGSIWGDGSGDGDAWDDATWGGGLRTWHRWQTVSGIGITAAPRIRVSTATAQIAIVSIDIAFEVGWVL